MKRTAYMTLEAVALVLVVLVPAYAQKTSARGNGDFTYASFAGSSTRAARPG